uniref:Uncharacterized protein n=1 Tax=viral metagenome TaxID=1070528 RepID=A0A6C0BTD2_9ZZZZ
MFFNSHHLYKHESIYLNDLHGYVLPHAGTEFSGNIISHTLRFKPTKHFNKVYIIYLPSHDKPNASYKNNKYYHEYLVPWKSFDFIFSHKNVEYIPINILENPPNINYDKNSIYIVSADFSHFLTFDKAIKLENKAAKSMIFRNFDNNHYNKIVDHKLSFKYLYDVIPNNFFLQWIGRTRSPGHKGVGYLSFLVRENKFKDPSGIFVTVYDKDMNAKECLGEWFDKHKKWSSNIEHNLINKVIRLGKQGRLTGGHKLNIPLTNYTVTYLYKKKTKNFIRGWHGILKNSFYLPDVFLENTHSNGDWINEDDKEWKKGKFSLTETFNKLNDKSGINDKSKNYTLFESKVFHYKI